MLRANVLHSFSHAFFQSDDDFRGTELPESQRSPSATRAVNQCHTHALGDVHQVIQVHGARVVEVGPTCDLPTWRRRGIEADGLVSRRAGAAVGVRTADCVPILLADATTGDVAAVHAGWRGAAAGIVREAVARLCGSTGRGHTLLAAIGPCIGRCCFEVGEEVVTALRESVLEAPPAFGEMGRLGRPYVDLRALIRRQLIELTIPETSIEDVGECTVCSPGSHSFRRDGAAAGRMLAGIRPLS